jgi:hypothetical protein
VRDVYVPPRIKPVEEVAPEPKSKKAKAAIKEAEKESALKADAAAQEAGVIVTQDKATFKLEGKKIVTNAPLREYTTRAGKTLKGVWVPNEKMAKEVDEHTWKAKYFDGNFFVRIQYVQRPTPAVNQDQAEYGASSVDRATIESIVIDNFRSIIENMKSAQKLTEDCK